MYWRVEVPCKAVGGKLCMIPEKEAAHVLQVPHDEEPFPWRLREDELFDHPSHEGTAVFTRPDTVRALHAMSMRELGSRIVAEVDDNYLSAPHLNMFMRMNKYGAEARFLHLRAMGVFDAIVFSTAWLRDAYHRAFKKELPKEQKIPELHVARNHVDLDDWADPVPPNGRLRVGWAGSPQHARDIRLAYPALEWAHNQGHEVVFVGHDVRDETGVTHPRALDSCRKWRAIIDTHIAWVDPSEYHRTALPFDVGLIPLERNDHTLGKSDVKALEMSTWGAAVIASNMEVYSSEWKHGETALLAGSPTEFLHWTQQVCTDHNLRERLVKNAQQYVREERNMHRVGKAEWEAAL